MNFRMLFSIFDAKHLWDSSSKFHKHTDEFRESWFLKYVEYSNPWILYMPLSVNVFGFFLQYCIILSIQNLYMLLKDIFFTIFLLYFYYRYILFYYYYQRYCCFSKKLASIHSFLVYSSMVLYVDSYITLMNSHVGSNSRVTDSWDFTAVSCRLWRRLKRLSSPVSSKAPVYALVPFQSSGLPLLHDE